MCRIPCHLLLVFILLLAPVLSSSPAAAETPQEQARVLFREGNSLLAQGDYEGALDRFRRAQKLYSSYKILLNIASTLNAMGRLAQAALHYDRFLRRGDQIAPAKIVRAARAGLAELKKKLVLIKVLCSQRDAEVLVDGSPTERLSPEEWIYLTPGTHRLLVKKTGFRPHELTIVLGAGQEKELVISLVAQASTPAPGPSAPPVAPASSPGGAGQAGVVGSLDQRSQEDSIVTARQIRRTKTIWAYSALGAGGALALTAAILYGVGASQGGSAHDSYEQETNPEQLAVYHEDVESARTKILVGNIFLGLAVGAIGFSVYQFLTRPSVPAEGAASSSSSISLISWGQGATLSWRGRF